jgi:hypothetical protein
MRTTIRILPVLLVMACLAIVGARALVAQDKVVVEERQAVVLKVTGNMVIVRNDKNEIHKYVGLPPDTTLMVNGKPAHLKDLRNGMQVTALRFQDVAPPVTLTEEEEKAEEAATEPAAAPAAAPAPAPAEAAPAPKLPPTASNWPTIGLLGLALLLAGVALRSGIRRQRA